MKTHTAISHLTGREQNALHHIINNIDEHLQPVLIFYFNSEARESVHRNFFASKINAVEWTFSCDLLVIVPNENTITNTTKENLEELTNKFGRIKLFIHPLDFFAQQLTEKNLFFSWVRSRGTVLLDKNNTLQLLPPPISKHKEYSQQAEQFYLQNPNFENYMKEKMVAIPAPAATAPVAGSGKNKTSASEDNAGDAFRAGAQAAYLPYPQHLSTAQISDPFSVLNSFSQEYDPAYARRTVASWLRSTYQARSWNRESPGNLLYFYEHVIGLIEAAWLIEQTDTSERLANIHDIGNIHLLNVDLYCGAFQKEYPWQFFPRSLTEQEFVSPYKVFSKFFRFHTLAKWKEELHEMLHLALDDNDPDVFGEVVDVLSVEKLLCKLMDAAHLIHIREFEWADGRLVQKLNNAGGKKVRA